jgi:hypothetical protein
MRLLYLYLYVPFNMHKVMTFEVIVDYSRSVTRTKIVEISFFFKINLLLSINEGGPYLGDSCLRVNKQTADIREAEAVMCEDTRCRISEDRNLNSVRALS